MIKIKNLVIVLLMLILLTGCGKKNKSTPVVDKQVTSETETTYGIVERVKTTKDTIQYEFDSDKNVVVKIKYSNKFSIDNETLENDNYSIHITMNSYKNSMFEIESESLSRNSNYRQIKIDGFDAVTASSADYATILVKLDNHNILNIIAETNGLLSGEEIINNNDYKELISNIVISVK